MSVQRSDGESFAACTPNDPDLTFDQRDGRTGFRVDEPGATSDKLAQDRRGTVRNRPLMRCPDGAGPAQTDATVCVAAHGQGISVRLAPYVGQLDETGEAAVGHGPAPGGEGQRRRVLSSRADRPADALPLLKKLLDQQLNS